MGCYIKVGDPGEVSIGDGLVVYRMCHDAANLGVGIDGSGVLTFPSQVSDGFTYNVTEISDRAFSDCRESSVTIPGTVRRVGKASLPETGNGLLHSNRAHVDLNNRPDNSKYGLRLHSSDPPGYPIGG